MCLRMTGGSVPEVLLPILWKTISGRFTGVVVSQGWTGTRAVSGGVVIGNDGHAAKKVAPIFHSSCSTRILSSSVCLVDSDGG